MKSFVQYMDEVDELFEQAKNDPPKANLLLNAARIRVMQAQAVATAGAFKE